MPDQINYNSILQPLCVPCMCVLMITDRDWAQVPDPGLKPGFFPSEWVGFFSLKTRVPGFPF